MNDITAIIRIRRGLDTDRRNVVLASGEIAYSTDTKRTFIGDGSTFGGTVVGNINHIGSTPSSTALKNDIYFDPTTHNTYILSSNSGADNLNNYAKITPTFDPTTLTVVDGKITINKTYLDNPTTGYIGANGGTISQPLIVTSPPTESNHVVTKGYVDQISSQVQSISTKFVKLSGDTMTGKLTILSSFECTRSATIGTTLAVANSASINGDLDISGNLFKNFRPVVKPVTLQSPVSTYELTDEDNGSVLVLSANALKSYVHCPDGFDIGYNVMIIQNSTSETTIIPKPSTAVTVNHIDSKYVIRAKHGICNIIVADESGSFVIVGDLI